MGTSLRHPSQSLLLACLLIAAGRLGDGLPSGRRLQQTLRGSAADGLDQYRRAGCDNFTAQWQPLRPGYHITVPFGWMNDPHGLFQMRGHTHLFFQYNPKALQWDAPFWGHVVSRDLVHWTWLPPALLPDMFYDRGGVWSGSATITDGGLPMLTYTAAGTQVPEMGNFFQQQALAVPEDMSDPLLKRWVKPATNPFLSQVPPGGTNFQFRDPTEARDAVWAALTSSENPKPLPKTYYALAVGNQAFCMGGAGMYSAPSMTGPWSYVGSLFNQLDLEPQINGQCMAASNTGNSSGWPSPAYGGPCDQFGSFCRMWEVVDFLELEPGLFMIKWDDQSHFREVFSMEWYVLGNGPWDYSALQPKHNDGGSSSSAGSSGSNSASTTNPARLGRKVGPAAAGAVASSDSSGSSSSSSSSSGAVFGQQYSTYPHSSQKVSVNDSGRNVDFNYVEAGITAATKSLFRGELDGQKFAQMRTDYGSVYASTVFRTDDKRQVMLSWMYETAAGCSGSCSDQLPDVISQMGFKGVQTLPRNLQYDKTTKTLRAYPVKEVALLRGSQVYSGAAAPIAALPAVTHLVPGGTNKPNNGIPVSSNNSNSSSGTARQMEVHLNFTLLPPSKPSSSNGGGMAADSAHSSRPAASGNKNSNSNKHSNIGIDLDLAPEEFAVGLRIFFNKAQAAYTDVYLRGIAVQNQQQQQRQQRPPTAAVTISVQSLSVWVDRSSAGGSTNTTYMEGGPVPLPVSNTWSISEQSLGLSVWIDHSVLEVFAMGGLARVTSRVYPEEDDAAWGLAAWSIPPRMARLEAAASSSRDVVDTASSSGSSSSSDDGFAKMVYCWWCKLWFSSCSSKCGGQRALSDSSSDGSSNAAGAAVSLNLQDKDWAVVADGQVWELNSAWLPPAC